MFLYTVTYIYNVLQRGPRTWQSSIFTAFALIFLYLSFPNKAKTTAFNLYQSRRASLTATFIYAFSLGEWGVYNPFQILPYVYFKKRWPPLIGSVNLFKNHKIGLKKCITFCTLKECQEYVNDQSSCLRKNILKLQCT